MGTCDVSPLCLTICHDIMTYSRRTNGKGAGAMAAEITEITTTEGGTIAQAVTVADVMAAYLAELDASPKTRDTYRKALRQYGAWLEGEGLELDRTTRAHVMAYKRHLQDTKRAATVNAYLVAGALPSGGVRGVRAGNQSNKDALTVAQARDVLTAPAEGERGLRDLAMVTLMVRRGLRTIEVSRADVGDMRPVNGVMCLYVQGKGHDAKDDFVVLGAECERAIRSYLKARGTADPKTPLFVATGNRNRGGRMTTRAISRVAKEAMREQGIDSPRLTAHSMRHTAVTLALVGGATVQEAQAMARHASISTTMRYAHNLERTQARAEGAIDALLAG